MKKTHNDNSEKQYKPSLEELDCLLYENGFENYNKLIKNAIDFTDEDVLSYAKNLRSIHKNCPNNEKINNALKLLKFDEDGPVHNGIKFTDYLKKKNVTLFKDDKFSLNCSINFFTLIQELGNRSRGWEKEVAITQNGWLASGAALLLGVQVGKLTNGLVLDIYKYHTNKNKSKTDEKSIKK